MRRAFALPLVFVACATGAQPAQRQPETSLVLTEKRALLMLPPRLVAGQEVGTFSISPSGRYLVAYLEMPSERPLEIGRPIDPPKSKQLVVWDSTTGTSRTLTLPSTTTIVPGGIRWFVGTERALVQTRIQESPVSTGGYVGLEWQVLDAPAARLNPLSKAEGKDVVYTRFDVSPVDPFCVRVGAEWETKELNGQRVYDERITLQTIRADGRAGAILRLPSHYVNQREIGWAPDGRSFQIAIDSFEKPGNAVPVVLRFDPELRNYQEIVGPAESYVESAPSSDAVLQTELVEIGGIPAAARSWWLASLLVTESPRALVVADAVAAEMSPGERFIAYSIDGALFTRQIIELSRQQYEDMKSAAARAVTISNAKQAALGLLMFAADNDDTLSADIDMERDINPYVKNSSILEGFVYTFKGGKLSDVDKPAETVLGYIEGPGGRAVAYLDGHVKWVPN